MYEKNFGSKDIWKLLRNRVSIQEPVSLKQKSIFIMNADVSVISNYLAISKKMDILQCTLYTLVLFPHVWQSDLIALLFF